MKVVILLLVVSLIVVSTAKQLTEEFATSKEGQATNDLDTEKITERINRDEMSMPHLEDDPTFPQEEGLNENTLLFESLHEGESIPGGESSYSRGVPHLSYTPYAASRKECSVGSIRDVDLRKIRSKPKKTITGYNLPFYLQITDDGKVFITEYGKTYIHVLNQLGEWQRRFAIPKGHPTGISIKGNLVHVTNHRKEIYTFNANTGQLLGVKYTHEPVGIAVDDDDLLYVTEWRTGRIQVYHRDGRHSHTMAIPDKSGQRDLRKIQFDKKGDLYVPAYYKSAIYVFSKCGDFRKKISVPGVKSAEGLFIDSRDRLYLTERSTHAKRNSKAGKVFIMDKNGNILKTLGNFKGASDVAVAPDGTLWVVDFWDGKIHLF